MVDAKDDCLTSDTYHEGENKVLKINIAKCSFPPSIEYSNICMSKVVDLLLKNSGVTVVIINQLRDYEYDYSQVKALQEIADVYRKLNQDERSHHSHLITNPEHERYVKGAYTQFQTLIGKKLKEDPFAAFVALKRLEKTQRTKLGRLIDGRHQSSQNSFLTAMQDAISAIEQTTLIQTLLPHASEYKLDQRQIYSIVFNPTTRPDFMYTKLISEFPQGKLAESYEFSAGRDKSQVNIFQFDDSIKIMYHLTPPEFQFDEEVYELLDDAKRIMSDHKPTKKEFVDPMRMREVFFNIGKDLLHDLMKHKNIALSEEKIAQLSSALLRYTVGFGLIELLLADPKVQDVNINSPYGEVPIFIVHQDYGDCYTNIYPTHLEVESWATKLRLISGRPLDEADPILDTELKIEGFSSRVSAITAPLSPNGLAFSFRRHRDFPWTFALYLQPQVRYMNKIAAGLLSFIIGNNATILIAGTRSSGKSSLLGSVLVEIMRKNRILTIEDSVTGDSEIIIKEKNEFKRTSVEDYFNSLSTKRKIRKSVSGHEVFDINKDIKVATMLKSGKINWSKISKLIRHKVSKDIYEIKTRTGRILKVTADHSLFTLTKDTISEIETKCLREKDFIAVPKVIPHKSHIKSYLELLPKLNSGYIESTILVPSLKKKRVLINKIGKREKFAKSTIQKWIRSGIIPVRILKLAKISIPSSANFKISKNAKSIQTRLQLDERLLTFIGLWIADGCYDRNSIIMSVSSKEEQELVHNIAKRFELSVKKHSDKFSLMLHSKTLKYLFKELLNLNGNAYTKRIPEWIFSLSKKQISFVLKGLFTGDGHAGKQEINISLCSRKLQEDVQSLLLYFGIIIRIGQRHKKDFTYPGRISATSACKLFQKHIGFLQHKKIARLSKLCARKSTHDSTDVIPISEQVKLELKKIKYYYYGNSNNNIGKNKLQEILLKHQNWPEDKKLRQKLTILANSNIFWDQIKSIRKLPSKERYVYDLSVPGSENFVTNNIVAHNTFELPQESLRALGYNLESLKVAGALASKGGSEVDPSIGIRSTLRLGDSAIFVGEVRSHEAIALFEAMRVGAAANVVAGTIHADSPYGVYDRVVNDIGVPKTSFKAIDIVVITNPVISGLKKYKRVLRVTEVRKRWEDDPLKEGAFVDLLIYNPDTDQLEVTADLQNGNSEILKRMAGRVKEFAGNWDAVWDNIVLRGECKQAIVDEYEKVKDKSMLEAEFVIQANDKFHIISDRIREKTGKLDNERILFEYKDWLKKEAAKRRS